MFFFYYILSVFLLLVTLPGSLGLFFLTIGVIFSKKQNLYSKKNLNPLSKLAVIIPAYNEEKNITLTLESLKGCDPTNQKVSVYVIADNCSDQTAKVAKENDVNVLERNNLKKKGKGHALEFAFSKLVDKGYDYFVVLDADTIVKPNFFVKIFSLFNLGHEIIQVQYCIKILNGSLKSRLQHIAFLAFNTLRPIGRNSLGFSSGILGTGFALTRKVILEIPYLSHSIVEDLEYHLSLIKNKKKVTFTKETTIYSHIPNSIKGVSQQRARWEGGRFRIMKEHIPDLFKSVLKGRSDCIEPLFDLLLLPLSYHVVLILLSFFLPIYFIRVYALGALFIVAFHILQACYIEKGFWKNLQALCLAPFFVFWKLSIIFSIIKASGKNFNWIRSERNVSNED